MVVVALTVGAVMYRGDDGNIKLVLGFVFGLGSGVSSFYFGTSLGSQKKDAVMAQQIGAPVVVAAPAAPLPPTPRPRTGDPPNA